MKAIGILKNLPTGDPDCFVEKEMDRPAPTGREILVKVQAVSVNPVDVKRRQWKKDDGVFSVLGWDASGTVEAAGPDCKIFGEGDEVYFSGNVSREGCDSEFCAIDERIVGKKPERLSHAQSAAMPLTSLTAWEAMFERMCIPTDSELNKGKSILLIGAAGGVGSIASQLASHFGLNVFGTASRPESADWARGHGVDVIMDRTKDFDSQIEAMGMDYVDYIFCMNSIEDYWDSIVRCIAPQGRICSIVSSSRNLEMNGLWNKSASFSWEFMSTRPNFRTADLEEQHRILNRVSELLDTGKIRSTLNTLSGPINAENLAKAHSIIESGKAVGKVVLESF